MTSHKDQTFAAKKFANKTLSLPTAKHSQSWAQVGGGIQHALGHFSGDTNVNLAWEANIGPVADKGMKYISSPIFADNHLYVMNVAGEVSSIFSTGEIIWTKKIIPASEETYSIGGGIAYENKHIYVTSPMGEVLSLNAADGSIDWRKQFSSPFRGSPIVYNGKLFAVSIDNETIALDVKTGDMLWNHQGLGEMTNIMGGSAPVIAEDMVLVPHSSGELCAYWMDNGELMWTADISQLTAGNQFGSLSDIVALPIVKGDHVVTSNHMNKLSVLDLESGLDVWSVPFGTSQTPVIAGDIIFVISSQAKLYALSKSSGKLYWQSDLQPYENKDDTSKRLVWYGPLLIDNQLVLSNSLGKLAIFDPMTGRFQKDIQLSDRISQGPIYVNETFYFVGNSGKLWRIVQNEYKFCHCWPPECREIHFI